MNTITNYPEAIRLSMERTATLAAKQAFANLVMSQSPSGLTREVNPFTKLGTLTVRVFNVPEKQDGRATGRRVIRAQASITVRSTVHASDETVI